MKLCYLLFVSLLCFFLTPSSVNGFQRIGLLPFSNSLFHRVIRNPAVPSLSRPRGETSLFMFDRFIRVITSNINSILKGLEDPEKVIEQAVLDMQNDLVRIRQSYADVFSTQKRMERQRDAALSTANEWYRRAQLALSKGEEALAREALLQKQQQMEIVNTLNKQLEIQGAAVEKLYASIEVLEKKISEAKRQKETFVARAKTAKTSLEVNSLLQSITGSVTGSNSMEAFERMKEKVESLETQAEVAGQTVPGVSQSLEDKFRALEGNKEVEDELNRLKGANFSPTRIMPLLPATLEDEFEQLKSDSFYNRRKTQ